MRVVVGPEELRDIRQVEFDRHREAMTRFSERAGNGDASRRCTLLLRSPASPPAQVLVLMKDSLLAAGVRVAAIVAKLEPQEDLHRLFAALSELSPDADASMLIRWARDPRLLDAHEQVTYGDDTCWSGDAMRRDADKRNPLVLFEANSPEAATRATRAFAALWAACVPVPGHRLAAGGRAKPAGAYGQALDAPIAALKPHFQGWPLVRH